jgi:hypothetical protein
MYYMAMRAGETIDPQELQMEKIWLGIGAKKAGPNDLPPF